MGLVTKRGGLLPLCLLILLLGLSGCGPSTPTNTVPTVPTSSGTEGEKEAGTTPAGEDPSTAGNQTTIRFIDVTKSSGVNFTYTNDQEKENRVIVESLGGGAGVIDFDRDGLLDLFCVGGGYYKGPKEMGGHPSALFRNRGDWKYENISAPAGGGFAGDRYKHGCQMADYDNDGFQDFIVCGYGGLQFWRNMGDGTFAESHLPAGLTDKLWSSTAAWGDFNADGYLDLYVGHYANWSFENHPFCPGDVKGQREVCPPKKFTGLDDTLYMNQGDGTFVDRSKENGLVPEGKCLGIVTGDFDLDGDQDIYVCNDTVENFLYINDGKGVFAEEGGLRGVATDDQGMPNGSMGVDLGDYNLDGLPDIWVANYQQESNALYRQDQGGFFTHLSRPLGITAVGDLFVGFGTSFIDFNRDGYEDILVANGHVEFFPSDCPIAQEPLILMNQKGTSFSRLRFPANTYFGGKYISRGLVVADLDNDGDLDLAVVQQNSPITMLRNDSQDQGEFLEVGLRGNGSNRDGIGARLELTTSMGKLTRFIKSGPSYLSQCDQRAVWGFPAGTKLESLSIIWPSGAKQLLESPAPGSRLQLVEPLLSTK